MEKENIVLMILFSVALAMGIVRIILSILQQPVDTIILGIGLTVLAIAGLDQAEKD